jgi:hypothetical protein
VTEFAPLFEALYNVFFGGYRGERKTGNQHGPATPMPDLFKDGVPFWNFCILNPGDTANSYEVGVSDYREGL